MSYEGSASLVELPLRVGARTVGRLRRRLVRVSLPLAEAIAGAPARLPGLPTRADGYFIRGLPRDRAARLAAESGLRGHARQHYSRRFAALDGGFDAYLAGFSAKTRSTLKRKLRRFAEEAGGAIDVRCFSGPLEVEEFHRQARIVSGLTYQERLLDAGLPAGALEEMRALARRDALRGWVLFLLGKPVAYLYAPAVGDTLIYAYLGYDPEHAALSPGTVLQFEAMRMLMAEGRFRWFDFTEGDGQHKRQFATGGIDSVDLLLLRPTAANLLTASALGGFDGAVALAKRLLARLGLQGVARAFRR